MEYFYLAGFEQKKKGLLLNTRNGLVLSVKEHFGLIINTFPY